MDSISSFGEWLRMRRQALLLSREDLAQRVVCAAMTLRKIEADERRPSLAVAERLAERLELDGDERTLFVRVARGVLGADRLPPPIPRRATLPVPLAAPASPPALASARAAPLLPSGTVTFLFTDIAGSSRLWEQHPQAMAHALAKHHALLSAAIAAQGGQVFQIIGDAFCAAFATAPAALQAALLAQRALRDATWGPTGAIH